MRAPRIASMPPALPKIVGAHQHAAAGSRRDCALRPIHAGERIEHLEEEDECRNSGALGEAFTVELDHERGQHEVLSFGVRDQPADGIGRMHDVGVGEQQIIGRLRQRRRGIDALLCRPELACPSRRQAAAGHDRAVARRLRRAARDVGGAVAAVVVDQDDRPPAAIVLREQRSDARRRCNPPRCAQAPRRRPAAMLGALLPPNRRARCSAKSLRGRAANRARPQAQSKRQLSREQSLRPTPGMAAEPQGPADRAGKNNSTYSMNWARKSWTGGPLLVDCRAVRLRAEWIPVSRPESALT